MIGNIEPPQLALPDETVLMLDVEHATVARETAGDSYDWTVFEQALGNGTISFTRCLNYQDKFEREILRLEGRALGVTVSRARDLHKLACQFSHRHRMAVISDRKGGWIVVLAKVETQVRRLLNAGDRASAFSRQAVLRRANP